jgi:predicted O-methyltransferase YrrM
VLFTPLAYLRYLLQARGSHAIHAPFLFNFYNEVIRLPKRYYAFGALDTLRLSLMQDTRQIQVTDLGAGSKHLGNTRSISQIARRSAASRKEGELLFRVVDALAPQTILELGTSIGLSTLYMAQARQKAQIHTIEGCPQTAEIAKQNFKRLDTHNIKQHVGNIDEVLPALLRKIDKIDLAYLDANHQYEATMRYFNLLLPALASESLLIFDDIHWSAGMQQAWNDIIQHPSVTISVDLFAFGLAFVNPKFSKEHFILRF